MAEQCTALTTDGSTRCGHYAVEGKTVCRYHGGASEGMPARTGRYARLPARLRERYEHFKSDPAYLELKHEIALNLAREEELIERVQGGLSLEAKKHVKKGLKDALKALGDPDCGPEDVAGILNSLTDYVDDDQRQDEVWDMIHTVQDFRRKLKETEIKRLSALNQVLTVTESYNLIAWLATFIEDNIRSIDEAHAARAVRQLHARLEHKGRPALPSTATFAPENVAARAAAGCSRPDDPVIDAELVDAEKALAE